MNDAEMQAIQQGIGQLQNILSEIQSYYNRLRDDKRKCADDIDALRSQVEMVKGDIVVYSNNSNIGTKECVEAMDSALTKLTKASNLLRN